MMLGTTPVALAAATSAGAVKCFYCCSVTVTMAVGPAAVVGVARDAAPIADANADSAGVARAGASIGAIDVSVGAAVSALLQHLIKTEIR